MSKPISELDPALRQYRHNCGSEDLVHGYDYSETRRIFSRLVAERDKAVASLSPPAKRRTRVCNCPYCGGRTALDPVRQGLAFTACSVCFRVFRNSIVTSWLEDNKKPAV